MGEYAEMETFAQMRNKSSSDLSPEELTEFYNEYEEKPVKKKKLKRPFACDCRKRFWTKKSLKQHKRDTGHV